MNKSNTNFPLGERDMEERLWNLIDGTVSPDEKTVIEKLLESDSKWKAKYRELLEVHQIIHSSEMDAPSMRFSKNVMEQIAKLHISPAASSYINKRIIWGIALFFITVIAGFLIYGFGQMSFTSGEETTLSKNINKLDFSKFFSNTWINVFMMINVMLGLFLLDNFLSKKRQAFRKQA